MSKKENNSKIIKQMEDYRSSDPVVRQRAVEEIVQEHQNYVIQIINKHFAAYRHDWWEDLFQSGIVGLLESLDVYDPKKSRPTTFFHFYILHAIAAYVAEFIQGTSSHYAANLTKINRAISELEKKGNLEPTATDIAIATGLKADVVQKALEIKTASQNHLCGDDSYLDSVASEQYAQLPQEKVERDEEIAVFTDCIQALPEEEKQVIVRKYGLFDMPKQSNAQIAQATGIPIERIRSYQTSAIRMLRRNPKMRYMFKDYFHIGERKEERFLYVEPKKQILQEMDALVDEGEIEAIDP